MAGIYLKFSGPLSFQDGDNSLFHSAYTKSEGVYLWVIKDKKRNVNYIHYIGETTSFAKRQREHITHIMGLNYSALDAESATQGVEKIIWKGMWRDRTQNAVGNMLEAYGSISSKIIDYVSIIDVYFAPTDCPKDIRRHIEGSIGWNLRNRHPEHKIFYPDDNRVGRKSEKLGETLSISSDEPILGLDSEIEI